jgi:hypothetical protein
MSMHERPAMSVDEAVRRRRSVRGFLPDEVPEATLRERQVDAAQKFYGAMGVERSAGVGRADIDDAVRFHR